MATPPWEMTRPAPAPTGGAASIGPGSLWRALRRYPAVGLAAALLAAATATAAYWLVPVPKMTASVVYHVAATPPAVLAAAADARIDFGVYRQQQVATIKGRAVVAAALAAPGVAELPMLDRALVGDPAAYLATALRADFPSGPEYLRVSLEGDDGEQLLSVLRAINSAYVRQAVDRDRNRRLARLDQLKRLQDGYSEDLRKARARLRKVMEGVGSGDQYAMVLRERFLETQIGLTQASLAAVTDKLRGEAVEGGVAGADNAAVVAAAGAAGGGPAAALGAGPGAAGNPSEADLDEVIRADPASVRLRQRQAEMAAAADAIAQTLREGGTTPKLDELRREAALVTAEIDALPARLRPEALARLRAGAAGLARRGQEQGQQRVARLAATQKLLTKEVADLLASRKNIGGSTFELEQLREESLRTEAVAGRVATEIEDLKPELDAPTRVTLWEEPSAVFGVEGGRRAKYAGLAGGAALLLGLALVQWLDLRDRRVHSAAEAAAAGGLAVLGTMPRHPRGGRGAGSGGWAHMLAESVSATRAVLLAPAGGAGGAGLGVGARTILVTSASSGEGKTSLTTHLAASLAAAGRRVLLIDADMRRPAAHSVLGVPLSPGLSDYLAGRCDAAEAAAESRVPGLAVLPAGRWDAAAAAALTGPRWRGLLAGAAAGYDFVLIDSPPVLPVADALSIARGVDGVLVSVMQGHSRQAAVREACDRLTLVGARMLGVVLAGATAGAGRAYYERYGTAERPEPADAGS